MSTPVFSPTNDTRLPVAIIGAGPVGLAAAAHLLERGIEPLVLEQGKEVGHSILKWGHVRLFSPWRYNIDQASRRLLAEREWQEPCPDEFPTGTQLVTQYLRPLAEHPDIASRLLLKTRAISITRKGFDLLSSAGRHGAPYVVRIERGGQEEEILAQAVIDASGTYLTPNVVGADGVAAIGEKSNAGSIFYGIPDILNKQRERYANRRVLVIGAGHSAFNVLQDLVKMAESEPQTEIHWAIRGASLDRIFGGGENDQLKERGKLGLVIKKLVAQGTIHLHLGVRVGRITRGDQGLVAHSDNVSLPAVDQIVAVTGFRPDLSLCDEIRLALDPATQSPVALAPLIDPNEHSCGTVRPHGADELKHPDENFYIVGMKSYGRAPTFLMLTGYEQVRSVVAAIAGDWQAAKQVELVLPETGVCHTQFSPRLLQKQPPINKLRDSGTSSCCAPECCA